MIAAACTMVDLGMGYPFAACKLGLALTGLRFAAHEARAPSCCSKVVKRPPTADGPNATTTRPGESPDGSRVRFGCLSFVLEHRAHRGHKSSAGRRITRGPKGTSQGTCLTVAFLNASTFDVK